MSRRNKQAPKGSNPPQRDSETQKKQTPSGMPAGVMTMADAFANPLFRLGYGSQSPLEATQYPLTRLTDNYALMNSLYRDNWVVQNVITLVTDDMIREWFEVSGDTTPEQIKRLKRCTRVTRLRERVAEGIRWGRLYGGAAGILLIRGHEGMMDQPLDLETVMPGSFAGLFILDRWTGVYPDLGLVDDMGSPDFGLPAYYNITGPETNFVAKVHHSRIIRFTGRDLPYLERIAEMWWGESEVEALYREVVNRDNVSANIAALTFRANTDIREVQNLDQLFALSSGPMQQRFWNTMQAQSVLRSNFGTQLVNKGDAIHNHQYHFTGLDEVYEVMMLNLCGASRIPMTKLFGRSPAGLNATGDGDLQNYYDYVDTLRESKLRPVIEKIMPVMMMSVLGDIPDDFDITFPPLWTPTAKEIAAIAKDKAAAVVQVFQAGLLDQAGAQRELKAMAEATGMFDTLDDETINANAGRTYQDVTAMRDPLSGMSFGMEDLGFGNSDTEEVDPSAE